MAGLLGGLFNKKKPGGTKAAKASPAPKVASVIHATNRDARRMGDTKAAGLPRFHMTASDQTSGRSGDRFGVIRAKLRHAFTPSQPVGDSRMFAGREDILKTVIRCIEDQRLHVVLYGERGIGKTSMLHMLNQAANQARYIVVYTSCGANSNFDETFRAAAINIPLLFHSGYAPTTAEAERGSSVADILPEGPLSPRMFGDICAKLTGTRVLIILDEFDRCESGAFRRDVAELIKNLSDRLGRVQLVLAGVAADLTELVEHIPSIRRNIFALHVARMSETEILQIIANGEHEAGLTFDPAASALIVSVAQGSPYIASLVCHHAGHSALDKERSTVVPSDIAVAVDQTLAEFTSRIGKPTLAHVRRLVDQGHGEAMAIAARASMASDGAFTLQDMSLGGGTDSKKAQQALDLLSSQHLLRFVDEDGIRRYSFVEDSLPIVVWIIWAQHGMHVDRHPGRVANG